MNETEYKSRIVALSVNHPFLTLGLAFVLFLGWVALEVLTRTLIIGGEQAKGYSGIYYSLDVWTKKEKKKNLALCNTILSISA